MQHSCKVFTGQLLNKRADLCITPPEIQQNALREFGVASMAMSPTIARQELKKLGPGKGMGADSILAELLRAGEFSLAGQYNRFCQKIITQFRWSID